MISLIEKLIVGEQSFKNTTERQQAMLLGQLAMVSAGIFLFYIVLDPLSGVYSFFQWYVYGLILSIGAVILNRHGFYIPAVSILLLMTIGILGIIALAGEQDRGVNFYFVSLSVSSLVFFYNRKSNAAYLFIVLIIAIALLAFFFAKEIDTATPISESDVRTRYIINFVLSTVIAVTAVQFLIRKNAQTENSLLQEHQQLERLSNDLEKSNVRFERAVKATKAGIYEWNIETGYLYLSPQWRQLLGYGDEQEIDYDFFLGMVHPEDVQKTTKSFESATMRGGAYQNELRLKKADGTYCWFLDSGIVQKTMNRPSLAVGSIIDINNRKVAETEIINQNIALQKANDELDRFVYSASHDLRAPLSTLLGLIELMRMSTNPQEYQEYFDLMTKRINDMEGFIAEVTDYSRNTRLELTFREVNLAKVIEDLIYSFETMAEQAKVGIETKIEPDLVLVTDETRLRVVLNNLLANAIKYAYSKREKKFVRIKADKSDNKVAISIEDNGMGIADEFKGKVFDMFFRASEDSTGSGLGLYIVKETLDKLNGEISFTTEVRKGTTFIVTLPAVS